jgi:hypothetical protein
MPRRLEIRRCRKWRPRWSRRAIAWDRVFPGQLRRSTEPVASGQLLARVVVGAAGGGGRPSVQRSGSSDDRRSAARAYDIDAQAETLLELGLAELEARRPVERRRTYGVRRSRRRARGQGRRRGRRAPRREPRARRVPVLARRSGPMGRLWRELRRHATRTPPRVSSPRLWSPRTELPEDRRGAIGRAAADTAQRGASVAGVGGFALSTQQDRRASRARPVAQSFGPYRFGDREHAAGPDRLSIPSSSGEGRLDRVHAERLPRVMLPDGTRSPGFVLVSSIGVRLLTTANRCVAPCAPSVIAWPFPDGCVDHA